ncbi:UNVERIFIED_CONTAM: hypothetical protein HDU68_006401, partial [Siphonaria sp. JEL0065]
FEKMALPTIIYRYATIDDSAALNTKLLAGWNDPFGGATAWHFWHKDAVLNRNNSDIPLIAVTEATGEIVGSCFGRIREWNYGLVASGPYTLLDKEQQIVDWTSYSLQEQKDILAFMTQWERCYEFGASKAGPAITEGRRYIHVRQMHVADGYRNSGIGSALIEKMLEEARTRDLSVQLESWGRGKDFYKKHGAMPGPAVRLLEFDGSLGGEQTIMVWN